jgi:hypothetical protein
MKLIIKNKKIILLCIFFLLGYITYVIYQKYTQKKQHLIVDDDDEQHDETTARCNPKAIPAQLCPGGLSCPQCGKTACPCPPSPSPGPPSPSPGPPSPSPGPPSPSPGPPSPGNLKYYCDKDAWGESSCIATLNANDRRPIFKNAKLYPSEQECKNECKHPISYCRSGSEYSKYSNKCMAGQYAGMNGGKIACSDNIQGTAGWENVCKVGNEPYVDCECENGTPEYSELCPRSKPNKCAIGINNKIKCDESHGGIVPMDGKCVLQCYGKNKGVCKGVTNPGETKPAGDNARCVSSKSGDYKCCMPSNPDPDCKAHFLTPPCTTEMYSKCSKSNPEGFAGNDPSKSNNISCTSKIDDTVLWNNICKIEKEPYVDCTCPHGIISGELCPKSKPYKCKPNGCKKGYAINKYGVCEIQCGNNPGVMGTCNGVVNPHESHMHDMNSNCCDSCSKQGKAHYKCCNQPCAGEGHGCQGDDCECQIGKDGHWDLTDCDPARPTIRR